MTNHTKFIKWVQTMGYSELESIGIVDNMYKKLLPFARKYDFDVDKFVGRCLMDNACRSLAKFKEIANHKIKRLKG